jgi:uncharacterized protein (DUF1015 family)
MMYLVEIDEPGLVILPTHRLVKNIIDFDEQKTIEMLAVDFEIKKINAPENIAGRITSALAQHDSTPAFAMYTGKDYYYMLTLRDIESSKNANPAKSDAYCRLDVAVLQSLVFDKVLGIDRDSLQNQLNLTYTHNSEEAEELAKNNLYQCAFFLNPIKAKDISTICESGEKMPQKSTYFYPKLITGLVVNKVK